MTLFFPHVFEATIERHGVGRRRKIWYNVVFLPERLRAELPFERYPRLRIEGEIADVPIANAFIPAGGGSYYLIVGPNVLRDGDTAVGDVVEVRFRIADQNHVDVPPELRRAIDADERSADAWDELTPGRRRMLAQHVLSAKTAPTRSRRVGEALDALRSFGGDLRAWRKARR